MTLKTNRPLSPHIQIYKPQISSLTSILHRATGIFLFLGTLVIAWCLAYYAHQFEMAPAFDDEKPVCDCPVTRTIIYLVILGWAFSLYYHLCNGIRHLFWDIGKGFDKDLSSKTGVLALLSAVFLTSLSVLFVIFII
jgi:succinate dehydrogenase / fumarate reductase, cytochrome b subunit